MGQALAWLDNKNVNEICFCSEQKAMTALESIDNKLTHYFNLLAKGCDVSPAQRFRLEGYLQACVELLLIERAELLALKLAYIAEAKQLTGLQYTQPLEVWALPYQVAVASVNANA